MTTGKNVPAGRRERCIPRHERHASAQELLKGSNLHEPWTKPRREQADLSKLRSRTLGLLSQIMWQLCSMLFLKGRDPMRDPCPTSIKQAALAAQLLFGLAYMCHRAVYAAHICSSLFLYSASTSIPRAFGREWVSAHPGSYSASAGVIVRAWKVTNRQVFYWMPSRPMAVSTYSARERRRQKYLLSPKFLACSVPSDRCCHPFRLGAFRTLQFARS